MAELLLACERCGHVFDPEKTIKGPCICPACGLTTHPFDTLAKTDLPPPNSQRAWIIGCVLLSIFLIILLINMLRTTQIERELRKLSNTLTEINAELKNTTRQPVSPLIHDKETPDGKTEASNNSNGKTYPRNDLSNTDRKLFDLLKARLDKSSPPYHLQDNVKLRLKNGQIQRGTFISIKDDAVLLLQNGKIHDITLSQLDRSSRIRIDLNFRERTIENKMKRATENRSER